MKYKDNFIEVEEKNFINVFKRLPIYLEKGKDEFLWDINGKKYIDFLSGISVCNLGHSNEKVLNDIKKQLDKLIHSSNLFYTEPQLILAEKLNNLFKKANKENIESKVFFANSGAEANECAIKIARKYGNKNNKYEIITLQKSFHGRTMATLSATGQEHFQTSFTPILEGFRYAKMNDFDSIINNYNEKTVAIMLELIQGEGGVIKADYDFIKKIEAFCKEKNLLFIIDEIQTGMARTGKFFAFEHFDISPDIVTMAKSLGGGIPLGAVLAKNEIGKVLQYGDHGSTFGGNILACTAGISIIDQLSDEMFLEINKKSKYFFEKLEFLKSKYSFIKEIRGLGLMIGLELDKEIENLVLKGLEKGVIINTPQKNIIRFLPPLNIKYSSIDFLIKVLDEIFFKN